MRGSGISDPFSSLSLPSKTENNKSYFFISLCCCLPLLYLAWVNRHYQLDDALIYLRYVRNFLNGEGLVYNEGVYFNGLTSSLYSYLLILAGVLISDLQVATILLAALLHASALLVLSETFFAKRPLAARCLFIILAGTFPYFFLTYGMETPLFILLIGLSLYCYQIEKFFWLGLFSGLLILTRAEGIFLIATFLGGYLIKYRRLPDYRYFIIPLIFIAVNLLFNKWYYGAFLPATGSAKLGQGQSGLWGDGWLFLDFGYLSRLIFGANHFYLFTVLTLAALGFSTSIRLPENRETHFIVLAFLISYSCFYLLLNIPNYHWYYAPYFIFMMIYCTEGLFLTGTSLVAIFHAPRWLSYLPLLLLAPVLIYWASGISARAREPFKPYKDIGIWLNQNTEQTTQIAMVEIGIIGWYSNRPIIDILGLVNPLNARFIGERKFAEWLKHYSPDLILIHDPAWPHEVGAVNALAAGRFEPDPRFDFPNYRLLRKMLTAQPP